jgi:hypothetical protein
MFIIKNFNMACHSYVIQWPHIFLSQIAVSGKDTGIQGTVLLETPEMGLQIIIQVTTLYVGVLRTWPALDQQSFRTIGGQHIMISKHRVQDYEILVLCTILTHWHKAISRGSI